MHKNITLIVQSDGSQLRIAGLVPIDHQSRLHDAAVGKGLPSTATFDVRSLTVILQTGNKGRIILRGI